MESDIKFDFDVMSDSINAYSGLHVKNGISLACFETSFSACSPGSG